MLCPNDFKASLRRRVAEASEATFGCALHVPVAHYFIHVP